MTKQISSLHNLNATPVVVTTIGVIFGLAGFNHGFFEFLQGNTPTDGLIIQAIGEAHRFWPEGTEEAFTIIPNFLISGILSMVLGLTIVVWSLGRVRPHQARTNRLPGAVHPPLPVWWRDRPGGVLPARVGVRDTNG
jgi:hypothetical protein